MWKALPKILSPLAAVLIIAVFVFELLSVSKVFLKTDVLLEVGICYCCFEYESEIEDSKEELEDFCLKNISSNSCIHLNKLTGTFYKYPYTFILFKIQTPPPEFLL